MNSGNDLIGKLPDAFLPEQADELDMSVQFAIEEPMYAVITPQACQVQYGQADSPDITLIVAGDDLPRLMTGEINGVKALLSGRLKIKGDIFSAPKLANIFDFEKLS